MFNRVRNEALKSVIKYGVFAVGVTTFQMCAPPTNLRTPLEKQVSDKLSKLLGIECCVLSITNRWHVMDFSSEQWFGTLEKFSNQLSSLGLKTELKMGPYCLDARVKMPDRIHLENSLTEILELLNKSSSNDLAVVVSSESVVPESKGFSPG